MLQVLNSKERNQAFTRFLLFFLVTVAVIVIAIYFDYQVPRKQNELLTEEINEQRKENNRQREFVATMQQARNLLDSISGTNITLADSKLTGKLNELLQFAQNDSTPYAKMNKSIVESFLEIQALKKSSMTSADLKMEIDRLKSELRDTKTDLDRCRNDYEKAIRATPYP